MGNADLSAAGFAGRSVPAAAPPGSATSAVTDHAAALDAILRTVSGDHPWTTSRCADLTLSSLYQPIIGTLEQRVVGYEGLLRAHGADGREVLPVAFFGSVAAPAEALYRDWLARALHLRNRRNLGDDTGLLFINASPDAAIRDPQCGEVFAALIDHCGVAAADVVVEITENAATDEAQLVDAVKLYKSLGCMVAIDDFGAGASDVRRIWRLRPDIVKIDRAVLVAAAHDNHARKVLRNLVNMIHDCGARVVLEGIGNRAEAEAAMETSADYLQGFHFGRPGRVRLPDAAVRRAFAALWPDQRIVSVNDRAVSPAEPGYAWRAHAEALLASAMAMEAGAPFSAAAPLLHSLPGTRRCYLLSADGSLLASSIDRRGGGWQEGVDDSAVHRTGWPVKRLAAAAAAEPGTVKLTMHNYPNEADAADAGTRQGLTLCCGFGQPARTVMLCVDIVPR